VKYSLVTVEPPAAEPVSLDLAKRHLRIDHDEEDDLIRAWIPAARELCEMRTGRRFGEQVLRLTLHCFPYGPIELPVGPVSDVSLLSYYDDAGDVVTVEDEDFDAAYSVWLDHNPPLVMPLVGEAWPSTETGRSGAVTVEFTAGAGEVPEMVKSAMLLCIGSWDENRGDQNKITATGLPPSARAMLDLLWTGSYR
jgi:uncharacterized phiE125 gp8 family phage protein